MTMIRAIPSINPMVFEGSKSTFRAFLAPWSVVWIALWFSMNTGPWVFRYTPQGTLAWLHAIRATFPLFIAAGCAAFALSRASAVARMYPGPLKLWFAYGFIGLLAGFGLDEPSSSAYWAVAYLAGFGVIAMISASRDPLEDCLALNRLTWIVTTAFLLTLVVLARDTLVEGSGWEMSGYGQLGKTPEVAGMAMSRSSGMARFAAVPGIVAFTLLWEAKGLRKLLWAVPFAGSAFLIYIMQSRGAIFGFAGSLVFVAWFLSRRTRVIGIIAIAMLVFALAINAIPEEIISHLTRGQDVQQMESMTGRTRAWANAWEEIAKSPLSLLWGYGFQSDRMLIGEHVHNTYLYALMTGGFVGAGLFIAGLVWTWWLMFRAMKSRVAEALGQKRFLIQAGGILAFFTIRSIPEVCGANFAVDLLVMLPILAYVSILCRRIGAGGQVQSANVHAA